MQLILSKFKLKKRLLTRIFITSLSIIALVGFGLAWLVNMLHAQNSYNKETSVLIAEIPQVAAELREHDLIPATSEWLEENNKQERYIMASCDESFQQVWTSALATERGLLSICSKFNEIKDQNPPYYLSMEDQRDYFSYLLSIDLGGKHYKLLVLKDADQLKTDSYEFAKLTFIRLSFILVVAFFLLISAAYWSMRPLTQMRNELHQIVRGKSKSLSSGYPLELEGITRALNQLLNQSSTQQQRYQNAMNDLAHSLKTRLAAVHAITDDDELSQQDANERIMDQVSQMDLLVKYQLKRAMLGRKGLKQDQTLILPLVEQLSQMLFKVYRDKQVNFTGNIPPEITFPGDQGDIMELCGNLMENAFRLCISKVSVSAYYQDDLLVLKVEDDGPGVDDAVKQKILQRGERADTQSPGQGIGLAVCHEIVISYNGQLLIEESKLEGACFKIFIPIR